MGNRPGNPIHRADRNALGLAIRTAGAAFLSMMIGHFPITATAQAQDIQPLQIPSPEIQVQTDSQTEPAPPAESSSAQGFRLPSVPGALHYSLSAFARETIGYNASNQTDSSIGVSGNVGFLSSSRTHPTSVTYSGGYLHSATGQQSPFFQELAASQAYIAGYWIFAVADSLQYVPESSTTGLSGIAGVGDLGTTLGGGGGTGTGTTAQQALTPYATRVSNSTTLQASRRVTSRATLVAAGYIATLRFLDAPGAIETDTYAINTGVSYRLDPRTTVGIAYVASKFFDRNSPYSFIAQTARGSLTRLLTRKLQVSLSGGPQFVTGTTALGATQRLSYTLDAHAGYTGNAAQGFGISGGYSRAITNGVGISFGAETDTLSVGASRRLGRSMGISLQANASQSNSLQLQGTPSITLTTFVGSLQVNRVISRELSAFAGYSAQEQSYSGNYAGFRPLNGMSQVVSFGMTYVPRSLRPGHE
jgi:hypothetical protein